MPRHNMGTHVEAVSQHTASAQGQPGTPVEVVPQHTGCAQTEKLEERRPAPRQTPPNKAVERTGKKLALFPSRSPRALAL